MEGKETRGSLNFLCGSTPKKMDVWVWQHTQKKMDVWVWQHTQKKWMFGFFGLFLIFCSVLNSVL